MAKYTVSRLGGKSDKKLNGGWKECGKFLLNKLHQFVGRQRHQYGGAFDEAFKQHCIAKQQRLLENGNKSAKKPKNRIGTIVQVIDDLYPIQQYSGTVASLNGNVVEL